MSVDKMTKAEAEEFLDITTPYTAADLKKAVRGAMKTWHPDYARNRGIDPDMAAEMFKQIAPAQRVLEDLFKNKPDGTVIMPGEPGTSSTSSASSGSSSTSSYSSTGSAGGSRPRQKQKDPSAGSRGSGTSSHSSSASGSGSSEYWSQKTHSRTTHSGSSSSSSSYGGSSYGSGSSYSASSGSTDSASVNVPPAVKKTADAAVGASGIWSVFYTTGVAAAIFHIFWGLIMDGLYEVFGVPLVLWVWVGSMVIALIGVMRKGFNSGAGLYLIFALMLSLFSLLNAYTYNDEPLPEMTFWSAMWGDEEACQQVKDLR